MPESYSNNSAAWQTAATLASTAANNWAASDLSRKQRKFAEKWAYQNREWALEDWQMQNEYNSPGAQMERFRQAGLNPHLIYGQTNTADAVRSTPEPNWRPYQNDYSGLGRSLMDYQDTRIKQAQYDNLRTQNTIMVQDAMLRAVQVAEGSIDVKSKTLAYDIANELKGVSLEVAKISLDKLRDEALQVGFRTQMLSQQAEYLTFRTIQLKQEMGIIPAEGLTKKQFEEVAQRISLLEKEGKIKDFEIKLNELGSTRSDASWERKLNLLLQEWGF